MKISSSLISKLIDEKYTPLEKKFKIALALILLIIPTVIFIFVFYIPNDEKIAHLQKQQEQTQRAVTQAKRKAAKFRQFQLEIEKSRMVFEDKAALLPKEKEIPNLLKDISALGSHAGLEFISFKPLANRAKDFYSEIPIDIKVNGPYHNVGYFFDEITKLERIVSVKSVSMGSPKKEAGEVLLSSSCQLLTYRFTNIKQSKKKKK